MFVLTKTDEGFEPTIDWLAKVIPLRFQDAVGQNFGWLKERAKTEKEERKSVKEWICYYFFEEDRWICLKEICWLGKDENDC